MFNTSLHVAGKYFVGYSLTMLIPALLSISNFDSRAFILSSLITAAIGFALAMLFKAKTTIRINDGFILVGLIWLGTGVFGGLPFYLSGVLPSLVDAIFESVSGFTTTGATVFANLEELPRGILLWRSLSHWLGGMGIIVLSVAFLPSLGSGAMQLFRAEVPGPAAEKLLPRVKETAKILWLIYLFLTLLQTILLRIAGMTWFEALNHAFATMATGGFSTRTGSIADFGSIWIELIIMVFMFAAGVNFTIYYYFFRKRWHLIKEDAELRFYAIVLVAAGLVVTVNLFVANAYGSWLEALQYGIFQVISLTTTTGFSTADFDSWPPFSRGVMLCLKFLGGSAGSTAGAIKMLRILILLKLIGREFVKILHPRLVVPIRVGRKIIPEEMLHNVVAFTVLYFLLFVAMGLAVAALDVDIVSAFSASVATLGNIGPGLELVGPLQNYGQLPDLAKALLTLNMLLGRLEIFTFLLFLSLPFAKFLKFIPRR